jgi:spermidine/putrescine transport system ATP-binding protein
MKNMNAVELINVTKRFKGTRDSDTPAVDNISLSIMNGEFFSLLGPSGCGKSTTLRMIAGFEVPTNGNVCIMGQEMGLMPPHLRPVNMVFQNYALFPHMTVFDNVSFGLRMDGVEKSEIKPRVEQALDLVQLGSMGDRRPKQLSGGQQQRVALARALVKQPALLLLDEPLGALDRKLRRAMQLELKHMQQKLGITFVYVTHDQEEAMTMSDRIAVMNDGRILQVGTPVETYEDPANIFVADFIGESNFIPARVRRMDDISVLLRAFGEFDFTLPLPGKTLELNQVVTLMVRPEKGRVAGQPVKEAETCSLPGRIDEVIFLGNDISYSVIIGENQRIVVRSQNKDRSGLEQFQRGDTIYVNWRTEHFRVLKECMENLSTLSDE